METVSTVAVVPISALFMLFLVRTPSHSRVFSLLRFQRCSGLFLLSKPTTMVSEQRRQGLKTLSVTFLGTASAQPSSTRNHSALALRLNSDVWLFDCGEATQHQLQKSPVKMGKIEKIFITHTHGALENYIRIRGLAEQKGGRRPYLWAHSTPCKLHEWCRWYC